MPKLKRLPKELNRSMVTGECTASYVHLARPWSDDPEDTRYYSMQMIFDDDDPWLDEAEERILDIAEFAFGENVARAMRARRGKYKHPFRIGNEEIEDGDKDPEIYRDAVFINAKGSAEGKRPPVVVDLQHRDIRDAANAAAAKKAKALRLDPDEDAEEWGALEAECFDEIMYSGCVVRVEVKFFPYDRDGGKGVACHLFRVKKYDDGERIAGGRSIEEAFGAPEEPEDEWDDNY